MGKPQSYLQGTRIEVESVVMVGNEQIGSFSTLTGRMRTLTRARRRFPDAEPEVYERIVTIVYGEWRKTK